MKYENWSVGYWCLKQYIAFADWLIHKKTIITGKEKIPKNKPIVFAPNHQNGLSDPLAILLNTRFQPVWLARADIFGTSKVVDTILRFLKIMPVYRLRDGKENLQKNEQTFSDSIKVLERNFALALFPEAAHSPRRQMLPHKKAVARIVFRAEEKAKQPLDIQIIPAGIYYSHYWKFNRTVIVNFGSRIPVKDYYHQYLQKPNEATIRLKTKIHESILPLVLHFKTKKYYEAFEKIRELYGGHFLKRQNKAFSVLNLFRSDQLLADKLDQMEAENPEEIENIVRLADALYSEIHQHKLRSWLIVTEQKHSGKFIINSLFLLLGLPLFFYGFLLNALPFFLIDRVVRKKVKDVSFWSTFFFGAGILLFPLFYLIELLAVAFLLPGLWWVKIIFFISLPLAGKAAFKWYILFRKTLGRWHIIKLRIFDRSIYNHLQESKQQLFKNLDKFLPL